jgi:hypothetical protein
VKGIQLKESLQNKEDEEEEEKEEQYCDETICITR